LGLDPECKWTEAALAQKLGVIQQTINSWISDIRARQRANRNITIVRLGRLGWTQEKIAKVVGLDRSAVSRIVQNTKIGEMHNLLSQGRDMDYMNILNRSGWAPISLTVPCLYEPEATQGIRGLIMRLMVGMVGVGGL